MWYEIKACVADLGSGISVVLHHRFNYSLLRAMDVCIMHRSIISSCQSTATSKIEKCCWSRVYSCKQCYCAIVSIQTFFTFTFMYNVQNYKVY